MAAGQGGHAEEVPGKVEGTGQFVSLAELLQTLGAEYVSTRQGQRLVLAVIVGCEADSALKHRPAGH